MPTKKTGEILPVRLPRFPRIALLEPCGSCWRIVSNHDNPIQTERRTLARRSRFGSLVADLQLLLLSPAFSTINPLLYLQVCNFNLLEAGQGLFYKPCDKKVTGLFCKP